MPTAKFYCEWLRQWREMRMNATACRITQMSNFRTNFISYHSLQRNIWKMANAESMRSCHYTAAPQQSHIKSRKKHVYFRSFPVQCCAFYCHMYDWNTILRLQTTTDMAKRNYSILQLLQPQASIFEMFFFTLHSFVPLSSNHNAHNANTPNSYRTCKVA